MKPIKDILFCRGLWFYLSLLVTSVNVSSCINEDLSNCNSKIDFVLRLKLVNAQGNDITQLRDVDDVILYIFDNNQKFLNQTTILANDVRNYVPVNLSYENTNDIWVVAWSNFKENQDVTPLTQGMSMQDALVKLKKNSEGFAVNPDDLFWGTIHLSQNDAVQLNSVNQTINNLVLSRQVAQLNITVKGLDPGYDDYYFIIGGSKEDTYNFEGKLRGNPIEYKQYGSFDAVTSLFHSAGFSMYPLSDGNSNTISIYRSGNLIASVNVNSEDGSHIVPIRGVMLNVLIDLTQPSGGNVSIAVSIKVTKWDEYYHWVEW